MPGYTLDCVPSTPAEPSGAHCQTWHLGVEEAHETGVVWEREVHAWCQASSSSCHLIISSLLGRLFIYYCLAGSCKFVSAYFSLQHKHREVTHLPFCLFILKNCLLLPRGGWSSEALMWEDHQVSRNAKGCLTFISHVSCSASWLSDSSSSWPYPQCLHIWAFAT